MRMRLRWWALLVPVSAIALVACAPGPSGQVAGLDAITAIIAMFTSFFASIGVAV